MAFSPLPRLTLSAKMSWGRLMLGGGGWVGELRAAQSPGGHIMCYPNTRVKLRCEEGFEAAVSGLFRHINTSRRGQIMPQNTR